MPRFNIIGAGRVGRTLGYLFHQAGLAEVSAIKNRTLQSANEAIEFIGAGTAVDRWEDLPPAELTLISTSDALFASALDFLLRARAIPEHGIVFHCSGALPASVLAPARAHGAFVGSMHPTKSFADPKQASQTFKGTYCGFDGDLGAFNQLCPIFEALGGRVFSLRSESKAQYHAAAVLVSNYVTTLIDSALELYAAAGVEQELAEKIIAPIIQEASQLALRLGCAEALTGPISRGDYATVRRHLEALNEHPQLAEIYRALGQRTTQVSAAQGIAAPAALAQINALLETPKG